MDLNMYLAEYWLKERMGEVRAAAMRDRLVQSLRTRRRPLRATVGQALVRLGHRVQGSAAHAPTALAPGGGAA
jgi:hypothetical protein